MSQRGEESLSTWGPVVGFTLLGAALVAAAGKWPEIISVTGLSNQPFQANGADSAPVHPFLELLKLVIAALIGIVVTAVHRRYHRDKALPRSLLQAQVLLCVAGAVVMVIIGNSIARAFGVAGAAGIVRFRTPVEDPKDTTILFLLVGLGMACGVGLLEIAGLGALFICGILVLLDRFGEAASRTVTLSVVADGQPFPTEHVNRVLDASVDHYEVREMLNFADATVKYAVSISPSTPIEPITQQLMGNGVSGVKSVSWAENNKKS